MTDGFPAVIDAKDLCFPSKDKSVMSGIFSPISKGEISIAFSAICEKEFDTMISVKVNTINDNFFISINLTINTDYNKAHT